MAFEICVVYDLVAESKHKEYFYHSILFSLLVKIACLNMPFEMVIDRFLFVL